MKKITLLFLLFIVNTLLAQNLTTGVITSPFTSGHSVKFDVNTTTDIVTMTMVFPNNTWFGVAFSNNTGGIIQANMGTADDDVIVGRNGGVEDRNMPGGTNTPPLDTTNNWTLVSNTLVGSDRTIVATRARLTGDIEDFNFPNVAGALPMLYAEGTSSLFIKHGPSRGLFMASLFEDALSTDDFENISVNLYPNPVTSTLIINAHSQILDNLSVKVYNVLGELVFKKKLNKNGAQISVSDWSNGVYIMKISSSSNNQSVIKRFIKI